MPAPVLTTEAILALAPDPASASAGRGLAKPGKWVSLGGHDRALWGECQGSGSKPYQTQIDLNGPAFKCSCPSRKFPCKHGIGLFLLRAEAANLFTVADEPAWVSAWLQGRTQRSEKAAEKAIEKEKPPVVTVEGGPDAPVQEPVEPSGPSSSEKRAAQRAANVERGVDELDLWLGDLIASGLATAPGRAYAYWDGMAARLVDAQAPGLSRMIRELPGAVSSGHGWPDRLLAALGRVHLLSAAYRRSDALPNETRSDIRALIGFTIKEEEVLGGKGIRDRWSVVGQRIEEEDNLKVARTWLWGAHSGRFALLLQFAPKSMALELTLLPGATFEGEVVFYPSATPLRAVLRREEAQGSAPDLPSGPPARPGGVEAALFEYAKAVANNPWLESWPFALEETLVIPGPAEHPWRVRDSAGSELPLRPNPTAQWLLLALTGGAACRLFGEWNGLSLRLFGAQVGNRIVLLQEEAGAAKDPGAKSGRDSGSPSHRHWPQLVKAALLGTARCGPLPPESGPEAVLAAGHETSLESQLLARAAVLAIVERSGATPAASGLSAPEPSPAETWPYLSPRAVHHARLVFDQYKLFIPEWFVMAGASGRIAPPVLLPLLLEEARKNTSWREPAVRLLGERGRWLAAMNPAWNKVAAPRADDYESAWQEGAYPARLEAITELRRLEPAAALALLRSTWAKENAKDRAEFLQRIAIGLGMADEEFLEACLDDKAQGVREIASGLLRRLPESRLVARMTEAAAPFLSWRFWKLHVTLPETFDKSWLRDGLVEAPPHKDMGERAWWLKQLVGAVPPAVWTARLGVKAENLWGAAAGTEWANVLRPAWKDAAVATKDADWVNVIWDAMRKGEEPLDFTVLALVHPFKLEDAARDALSQLKGPMTEDTRLVRLLHSLTGEWSLPFTRAVFAAVQAQIKLNNPMHRWVLARHCDEIYARRFAAGIMETMEHVWPEEGPERVFWDTHTNYLLDKIRFREAMRQELTKS